MKVNLVLVAVALGLAGCSRKAPPAPAVATPAARPPEDSPAKQELAAYNQSALKADLLRNRQELEDVNEKIARLKDEEQAIVLFPDEPPGTLPFEERVSNLMAKQVEQIRTGREIDLFPGEPRPATNGLPQAKAEQIKKEWLEKRIQQEMTPTDSPESQRAVYVAKRAQERSRKRLEELKQEMRSRGLPVRD